MPTNDWFANLRDPLGRRARNDGARGRYAIRFISLKPRDELPSNVRITPAAHGRPMQVGVRLEALRPSDPSRPTELADPRTHRVPQVTPTIWLVEQPDGESGLASSEPQFRITGLTGAFTTYVKLEDAVGAVLRHEQPGWAFAVHELDRRGRPKDRPV